MRHPLRVLAAALTATALLVLGCSPAADNDGSGSGDSEGSGDTTTVTFRLWDDQVAKAYKKSFAAFEKQNPKIDVKMQVIPWDNYWTKLTADISSGNVSDIFWTNTSNFGLYADNGKLIDIGARLGGERHDWKQSVVDLYTRNDKLWGVPQLWDSIALYYNKDMVKKARVDPTKLRWDPSGKNDTFLKAAKRLTLDTNGVMAPKPGFNPQHIGQYGFNASFDGQAIYWDFVGSNGGTWQDGDRFAVDNPKTVEAIQYVVDLINKYHVAPSAADTNENGDKTRNLFLQQKMALFQSGPYNLKNIQEGAKFDWGIAPMLKGPAGRVGVVHGVAALGSAQTHHLDATVKVLKWMGSKQGQLPIAKGGYAFPGVTSAESAFVDYWKGHGVDVTPFLASSEGTTFPAPVGPRVQAGATAMDPILKEVFLGRTPVEKGLAKAQKAGNDAIKP